MSVKVTTPTKSTFTAGNHCDDKLPQLRTSVSDMSTLSGKLDDIVNFAVGRTHKSEHAEPAKRDRSGSNATKSASVKKWRRASEKSGSLPYHTQQSKKKNPKFDKQKEKIKLPTKFLLGGNINDPLNLNSMDDEEINKALNAETPVSSPLPTPSHRHQKVEVLIPPNINDPLNLNSGEDVDLTLVSPRGSCKKRKKYKRKKSGSEACVAGNIQETAADQKADKDFTSPLTLQIDIKSRKVVNEIVSPAIPQDSPKPKRKRSISETKTGESKDGEMPQKGLDKHKPKKTLNSYQLSVTTKPKFRSRDDKFHYGNYDRYYGKRNLEMDDDSRLNAFKKEWFDGKDILDIGCNIGHITLSIARDFGPKNITGMDIDPKLISIARKNVRHYMSSLLTNTSKFPLSLPTTHGPIAAVALPTLHQEKSFPNNVNFVQGNYVLDSDELLELQKEEFDVILALSITKWLHLNFGDEGLKRAFKRMFRQLRPGGKLVLEPQSWNSYKKKKKLNETIWQNYQAIQFRPDKFKKFLLSDDVGFSRCEFLDIPFNRSKGFQRPVLVLTKPDTSQTTPREVTESRGVTPLMNIDCGHSYTPRFDAAGYSDTPNYDLHPSYSFSSTHLPIRGYDAFIEGQINRAFTPTQELIAATGRAVTPRFDIGTPSVSARNTPSQPMHYSDDEAQWASQEEELFEQLSDDNDHFESELSQRDDKDVEDKVKRKIKSSQSSSSKPSLDSQRSFSAESKENLSQTFSEPSQKSTSSSLSSSVTERVSKCTSEEELKGIANDSQSSSDNPSKESTSESQLIDEKLSKDDVNESENQPDSLNKGISNDCKTSSVSLSKETVSESDTD